MAEEGKEVSAPLDLEKIRSGVRFLGHPDVQATPLSERLAFLEKKGLSRAEINAAIEQHHQATPLAAPEPPQTLLSFAWSILFPVISTATLMGVLWKFLRNDYDDVPNGDTLVAQQGVVAKTSLELALEVQADELRKVVQLLQEETKSRRVQSLEHIEHAREVAKLQAEIAALKLKLSHLDDAKKAGPGDAKDAPQATSENNSSVGESTTNDFEAQVQKLLDALDLVARDNAADVIKQAAAVLVMYTKNLVEHPEVPRYRRIATGNANFKQKFERLEHHDALLTSIGFEKAGMNLEWKWHSAPAYGKFVDILKAAIHAFEDAVSATPSATSLADSARRHLDARSADAPSPASTDPPKDTNLSTFLHKLKTKDDPTAEAEPKYPASFSDVVSRIKKGEPVPGIREIEDKLSSDTDKVLQAATAAAEVVPKPWST